MKDIEAHIRYIRAVHSLTELRLDIGDDTAILKVGSDISADGLTLDYPGFGKCYLAVDFAHLEDVEVGEGELPEEIPADVLNAAITASFNQLYEHINNSADHVDVRANHCPWPQYLRELLGLSGLSQREAARRLGVSERMMRYYLSEDSEGHREAPYLVQFGLEALALEKAA
ncbi:hypothetical protein ATO7_07472 [Oceanococcus atlanticus]|uniref:Uncharacterized protein n=1 Tax=Oceanococcus atlanticus TaxID=1317117 RepID=A0A1Y1SD57_9GAMM|nr:helix-turn-helix domain-containing protein [Oceanococcus atlanticus]ORE86861.1 hypothetical protein ATO7_07472 [Oceanococcus atlanticus]